MGLDANAYKVEAKHASSDVDFTTPENVVSSDLMYWRKHSELQRWMEKLYRDKGGKKESFNCTTVRIDDADLDELKRAMVGDNWSEWRIADDAKFIVEAREAIENNFAVYYYCWW